MTFGPPLRALLCGLSHGLPRSLPVRIVTGESVFSEAPLEVVDGEALPQRRRRSHHAPAAPCLLWLLWRRMRSQHAHQPCPPHIPSVYAPKGTKFCVLQFCPCTNLPYASPLLVSGHILRDGTLSDHLTSAHDLQFPRDLQVSIFYYT